MVGTLISDLQNICQAAKLKILLIWYTNKYMHSHLLNLMFSESDEVGRRVIS